MCTRRERDSPHCYHILSMRCCLLAAYFLQAFLYAWVQRQDFRNEIGGTDNQSSVAEALVSCTVPPLSVCKFVWHLRCSFFDASLVRYLPSLALLPGCFIRPVALVPAIGATTILRPVCKRRFCGGIFLRAFKEQKRTCTFVCMKLPDTA